MPIIYKNHVLTTQEILDLDNATEKISDPPAPTVITDPLIDTEPVIIDTPPVIIDNQENSNNINTSNNLIIPETVKSELKIIDQNSNYVDDLTKN